MRVHIQQDRNRLVNRITRLLETIKRMADKALGQLRFKLPELILALDGRLDPHFRWMLKEQLRKLDGLDSDLASLDRKTEADMEQHQEIMERLCTIPGIQKTLRES